MLYGKLQRNPVTSKLMRNPVTSKLMRSSPYSPDDCECFDAGKTPLHYTLVISGVTPCPDEMDLNGIYKLTQYLGLCIWANFVGEGGAWQIDIKSGSTIVWVRESGLARDFYYFSGAGCILSANDIANQCTVCNESSGHYLCDGVDGVASWCQGWHPEGCS